MGEQAAPPKKRAPRRSASAKAEAKGPEPAKAGQRPAAKGPFTSLRAGSEPAKEGPKTAEAPLSPAQTIAAHIVEDSIYSDRFILAVGKMSGEEIDEVRRELSFEWSRRSQRRAESSPAARREFGAQRAPQRAPRSSERRSVSNFISKSARLPWSERPATTFYSRLLESFGMASVLGSINKAVSQLAITEPGRYPAKSWPGCPRTRASS